MMPDGRGGGRGLITGTRRDDRGPIFHAKTSRGKIVAQVHYASRLPRVLAKARLSERNFTPECLPRIRKMQWKERIYMKNIFHKMKIERLASTPPRKISLKSR